MDNLFLHVKPDWKLLIDGIWARWGPGIQAALEAEREAGYEVYPGVKDIMRCFSFSDLDELKVVILGQDPYINAGEAHGLAFSVPDGVRLPPSLRNVYKCLTAIYGSCPPSGNLESWAQQGVLLLNTALTVRAGASGSHIRLWAGFTEELLTTISAVKQEVVYILWGEKAKAYIDCIDLDKNLVLSYSHPSPLSRKDFSACPNFRDADEYFKKTGRVVKWV
jgi:uracil-DNA glycosylase